MKTAAAVKAAAADRFTARQMMGDKVEFRDFFRFTRDGKMKSGTAAYSISLAALFLIIYGAAYYFLIDVLAPMTVTWPVWASDLSGAIIPGIIGTLVCMIPVTLLYDRKWALYGYLWIALFALIFLIAMTIMLRDDREAQALFLRLFLIMVPAPLILGSGTTWLMMRKQFQDDKREDYD